MFFDNFHGPPGSLPSKGDLGLSWIELAISFVLATGLSLPICLPGIGHTEAFLIDSDKIQLLPPGQRCLRLQAETLRNIVQTLQSLSRQTLVPAFAKSNCRSLLPLQFEVKHASGPACRPNLPNSVETMQALQTYIDDLDCDPPFHSNRPFHLPLQVPI